MITNILGFLGGWKFKAIAIAAAVIFVSGLIWKVVNQIQKAERLEAIVKVQEQTIQSYKNSEKYHKDVIKSMSMRIEELRKLEVNRQIELNKRKDNSKTFTNTTKTQIGKIEKEAVDPYLKNRYNTVIKCVEDVTKDKPDDC